MGRGPGPRGVRLARDGGSRRGRCGLRRGDADGLAARALVDPRGWASRLARRHRHDRRHAARPRRPPPLARRRHRGHVEPDRQARCRPGRDGSAGRLRDVRHPWVPPARAGPGPGPRGVRPGRPADPGAEAGSTGSGGARRGTRRARLRPRARFAGPRPVRRRDGPGAPGPPSPRPEGRRRLDVQLAGLVTGCRAGLARLPHRRRPPPPARQRPPGLGRVSRRRGVP